MNQPSIQAQPTPNPRSIKFVTDRTLIESGSADFRDPESALQSPLARRIFDLDGVTGLFVCQNFITVTARAEDGWRELGPAVFGAFREFLASGEPAVDPEMLAAHGGGDDEASTKIREILDSQIRPAVAMDGGDIMFVDYREGVVYLKMQGACGGCPSATATLKQGIETRLREAIPELVGVEPV